MESNNMEKYVTDAKNLKATIDKYGVAIIRKVISDEECINMLDGIWNYFEHITQNWDIPINRNNENSWKEFYKLRPLHSMLVQHWNIGHAQVSWDIRQNEKIVNIFSTLWGVKNEDLLVSFDGLSFSPPPETTGKGFYKSPWLHTDQSYTRNNFECIQSWISCLDINKGDATLMFLEGSNNYHKECADRFNITDKDDWYVINNDQYKFYTDKGCSPVRIVCGKGDMVFFDSRTQHMGSEPLKDREVPNFRAIIYLTYLPRKGTSEANLRKKQKAFKELRTTKHHPQKSLLFGKNPRVYNKDDKLPIITEINPPVLTELGKKLAGF